MGWEPDWIKEIEDAATHRRESDASRQFGPGDSRPGESDGHDRRTTGDASQGFDPLRKMEAVGPASSESLAERNQPSTRLEEAPTPSQSNTPEPGTTEFAHPRSFVEAVNAGVAWTDWSPIVPGLVPVGQTSPEQGLPALERLIASGPPATPWEEINELGRRHNRDVYDPRPSATKPPSKAKKERGGGFFV